MSRAGEAIPFVKMSGGGNDFIILHEEVAGRIAEFPEFVRSVCRRGLSVGADGLLVVGASVSDDIRLIHWNSDGGQAALCGNGTRCAARWAWARGMAPDPVRIQTDAGPVEARGLSGPDVGLTFELTTGPPEPAVVRDGGEPASGYVLEVGIPHFLVELDTVHSVDVQGRGERIRRDRLFQPAGTNVSFVARRPDGGVDIRTFERGVEAETLSCGTACVAAGVLARHLGWCAGPVVCHTRSGVRLVAEASPGSGGYTRLGLSGDARWVYEGSLGPEARLP